MISCLCVFGIWTLTAQNSNRPVLRHSRSRRVAFRFLWTITYRLCIDVYNDRLYETLVGHNWPARSLAQLQAATVSRDMDAHFVSYNPPGSDLHHRDPSIYWEMLEIIGNLQKQTLNEELKSSIAFAIQLDGCADRHMVDNKFTSVHFVKGPPTYELCTGS